MPLEFEYSQDWRLQSVLFRHIAGMSELKAQARRKLMIEMVWLVIVLAAANVALFTRSWLLFAITLGLAAWKLTFLLALRGLARRTAFALRSHFRQPPTKRIRLVVDEAGLREFDAGVESFAPWSAVKRFAVFRRVVSIQLASGLYANVPAFSMSADSPGIDALVACLEAHAVPRTGSPS